MPLKPYRFDDREKVEIHKTPALKTIPKTEFQDYFRDCTHRWKLFVKSSEGCYQPDDEKNNTSAKNEGRTDTFGRNHVTVTTTHGLSSPEPVKV